MVVVLFNVNTGMHVNRIQILFINRRRTGIRGLGGEGLLRVEA